MQVFKKLIVALSASILGACATVPSDSEVRTTSQSPLPATPSAWQAVEARVLSEPIPWIETFDDATLTALVNEAMQANPDLNAARAQIERARGIAGLAGAALSPRISVGGVGEGAGEVEGSSLTQSRAVATFTWEADLWGRLAVRRNAAERSVEAVEADYRGARNLIAATVAQSYFLSIEAGQQENIARALVEALTEIERIVELRFSRGFASSGDAALARSDLASAQEQLAAVSVARRNALRALETLVGRYPAADIVVEEGLPKLPELPSAGLPSDLLERRPDLIAAERRVAAALGALEFAQTARLPQLSLTGELGEPSQQLAGLLTPGETAWQAATFLLAPVLTGGQIDADKAIASSDVEFAVASYTESALNAFSEVESALDQSQALNARAVASEAAYEQSLHALDVARKNYEVGEIALLDVLILQQRVFDNESRLVAINREQLGQRATLHLALGDDWDEPDGQP